MSDHIIEIPYEFPGSVRYYKYDKIVERIKKFNYHLIGRDQSGIYDMYLIEVGTRGKPVLFFLSGIHGTEWHPIDYGLSFFEMLRDGTFPDKEFRDNVLSNYHLVYIPAGNPWGVDNNEDIYRQFNNPARYNSTGTELNRDFFEFTQRESVNIAEQVRLYKPFAFIDMHMFQTDYNEDPLIIANSQIDTEHWRDIIVRSVEYYSGHKMTVWRNPQNPDPESGLARRFVSRQPNPYTPHTLSYITEQVRPTRKDGHIVRRLTDREIYSIGIAELYLFVKTSIDYLNKYWQPVDPIRINPAEQSGLTVRDRDMRKIGVLENAYNISVERRVNELWTASFELPIGDIKQHLCSHMNYIEIISPSGRNLGLYRIMPKKTRHNERAESIVYECEHVLATLLDDIIDGYMQFTNYNTRYVLQALLNMQTVKHWEVGNIEFERYFHYSFENENGLLAPILSIPKPFNEPYMFTFDTTVYPWQLKLVRVSDDIVSEIRWGKDMIDFEEVSDPSKIVNYIVPKGAGEGVNQLDIKSVNDGKPYLKNDDSISKWGVHKYIWIDRRFEDAESLKRNAEALLKEWSEPTISFECRAVDLSIKPEYSHERKILGGLSKIIVNEEEYYARIISEKISDLSNEWDVDYELNNKSDDITTSEIDTVRSLQINEAYSQGATNILTFGYQDNADNNVPAVIPFYIDDDVVNVNTCELTFRVKPFRAYSRATEGGGAVVTSTSAGGGTTRTTSSGGGTTRTTSSGGGTSRSTASGGGSTRTSSSGGGSTRTSSYYCGEGMEPCIVSVNPARPNEHSDGTHVHGLPAQLLHHTHQVTVPNHTHTIDIPTHTHEFTVPNHTPNVEIPSHTHNVEIPDHTHEIEIPDHTHEVKHEIIELDTLPSSVIIRVDGRRVPYTAITGDRINLIDYIEKDQSGKIKRGRHEVTITPNRLGRIEADLVLRVFIQSQIGGVY